MLGADIDEKVKGGQMHTKGVKTTTEPFVFRYSAKFTIEVLL